MQRRVGWWTGSWWMVEKKEVSGKCRVRRMHGNDWCRMFGVKKATPLNLILKDELESLQVGEELLVGGWNKMSSVDHSASLHHQSGGNLNTLHCVYCAFYLDWQRMWTEWSNCNLPSLFKSHWWEKSCCEERSDILCRALGLTLCSYLLRHKSLQSEVFKISILSLRLIFIVTRP